MNACVKHDGKIRFVCARVAITMLAKVQNPSWERMMSIRQLG